MLFEFNFFWKFVSLMVLSWVFYGVWGFEFAMVTLMSALLATQLKK